MHAIALNKGTGLNKGSIKLSQLNSMGLILPGSIVGFLEAL